MSLFRNEPGYLPRVMLLGGTSEIGLAILAALDLPASAEVILAGRDEQRLEAAGKELPYRMRSVPYDAVEVGRHQAFVDGIFAEVSAKRLRQASISASAAARSAQASPCTSLPGSSAL